MKLWESLPQVLSSPRHKWIQKYIKLHSGRLSVAITARWSRYKRQLTELL